MSRSFVELSAGGETYRLRVSMLAMAEYQEETGTTFLAGAEALENKPDDMKNALSLFHAALIDQHEGITKREASAIASEVGLEVVLESLVEAITLAFPKAAAKASGDTPKAGKRKAGKAAKTKT